MYKKLGIGLILASWLISLEAHDNIITFPMCTQSTCEHIPSYIIRAETGIPLSLAWNPVVCVDCRIDWELIKASTGGVISSGTSLENQNAEVLNIPKPGLYELKYITCTNISTTPVCTPADLSRDKAAEAHGFMIEIRLAAPGGGGIG